MRRDPMFRLEKKLPLRVLSEYDFRHWQEEGYVIVRNAVPQEKLDSLISTLWDFTGTDPHDPSTWYGPDGGRRENPRLGNSGMVEIYHHQHLWDIRQEQRIYDAFVDIWDREDLWVSIDRANLNLPNKGTKQFGGFVHWDMDTTQDPLPFDVQGVVSLVDTSADMGGTQAYPALFSRFEEWARTQPPDRDPYKPDTTGLGEATPIVTKAGDLFIFNRLLAHGVRGNDSGDRVRFAQYLAMRPAREDDREMVDDRIRSFTEGTPVSGRGFAGDPTSGERSMYPPPELTSHGERLLGKRSWKQFDRAGAVQA